MQSPNALESQDHTPDQPLSRAEFVERLETLGAKMAPQNAAAGGSGPAWMRVVHFSRPYDVWKRSFGELRPVQQGSSTAPKAQAIQTWEYSCSDGPVLCIGQLYERSPGLPWVNMIRLCFPAKPVVPSAKQEPCSPSQPSKDTTAA